MSMDGHERHHTEASSARRGPGITMAFRSTPVPEIASWAADAERRGVPAIWLSEAWRELSVPLTAVAAATQRIPIGTGVMQVYPAHPVVTALQAMQLQEISGGRFELGLGLGAGFVVERWFGIPYERPLRRMKEFVEVVRGAIDSRHGRPFSYSGDIFRIHNYSMPFGAGLPDVPVSVAAVGPKMLELAGEVADGVVLGAIHSPEYLAEVRRRLAAGADRAGRDASSVTIYAISLCAASVDREESRTIARGAIAYTVQYSHYRDRMAEEGFGAQVEAIAAKVRAHEQEEALALIGDDMVDRFTISGTPEECRTAMSRTLSEVDVVMLTMPPFRMDETETAARVLDAAAILNRVRPAP
jgi:alkanesulfonate monooxygenase SsuD/methylene tetrahydromethanopterin reductase-like flavin-dependent oxidoreductase (luciferase family)